MTLAEACAVLGIARTHGSRMGLSELLRAQLVPNQNGGPVMRHDFDPLAVAVFAMLRAARTALLCARRVRRAASRAGTIATSKVALPAFCPHTTRPVNPASCSQCRGAVPSRVLPERLLDDVDTGDAFYVVPRGVSRLGRRMVS